MKPGYKTSEFWLSLLVMVLGALMSSGVVADGGATATIIGGALTLLSGGVYTLNRMGVKKADTLGAATVASAGLRLKAASEDPTKESV